MKTAILSVGPDAILDAIRKCKTSELILTLARPALARTFSADVADQPALLEAIAAEIDRRIPVPDPRIGKLCRHPATRQVMRVVGCEADGALRLRSAEWPRDAADLCIRPDLIVPGDWIDG